MPRSRSSGAIPGTSGLIVRLDTSAHVGPVRSYAIAGRTLVVDTPLPPLAPFAVAAPAKPVCSWSAVPVILGAETPIYRGPGWFGGRFMDVACSRAGDADVVRVECPPTLLIDRAGCRVQAESGAPIAPEGTLIEVLLGPGLVLPLALGGVFSLHASAVAREGRAMLLLGESGAGKSTIARTLVAAGFLPIADDVLPAEGAAGRLEALPHYPQLKVPSAAQYARTAPARVRVAAIVVLEPGEPERGESTVAPVAPREGFLALSRHTVAARLFDAPLLAAHAAFCAAAVEAVGVHTLVFPRRLAALPAMVEALTAHLATRTG